MGAPREDIMCIKWELSILQKNYEKDCDCCCGEVFRIWLDIDHKALWSTMLEALNSPIVAAVKNHYTNPDGMLKYNRAEMSQAVNSVAKCLKVRSDQTRYDVSPDQ